MRWYIHIIIIISRDNGRADLNARFEKRGKNKMDTNEHVYLTNSNSNNIVYGR